MEPGSPEPASGSASGTNRALFNRIQQDFLEDNDDQSEFNSLMQNHLRVIQEQAESQQDSKKDEQSDINPQSPVSGVRSRKTNENIESILQE